MSAPLISLLHPTRRVSPSEGFPRGWRDVFDAWLSRADHPERIEYVLSVHSSRYAMATERGVYSLPHSGFGRMTLCENPNGDSCVDNLNNAAKHSTGKLLVGTMDDLYPPEHWDTLLLEALLGADISTMPRPAMEQEAVIVCSSGAGPERDRTLMIAGALTRKRYERYGFILDPAFESMFADNWYAHLARRDAEAGLCKIIERLDIQFDHRHPILTDAKLDEAYAQQNRIGAYQIGQATFMRKAYGTKVILLCLPGETFRAEVFWGHTDLMLSLSLQGPRFIVQRSGAHTSNVYHTRIQLAEGIEQCSPRPDFVLWVDDDNILAPAQFEMLYQDLVEHPELDGVVGWCWCDNGQAKEDGSYPEPVMSVGRQDPDNLACLRLSVAEQVEAMGSGRYLISSRDMEKDGHNFWSGMPVCLFRASVHERLGWQAFKPIVRDDVARGFTSEDTSFFLHAAEAGMNFAVDLRVKVPHGKFRAIEPQYVPATEKAEALKARGEFVESRESCAAD